MKLCSYDVNGSSTYGAIGSDGTLVDLKTLLGASAPRSLDDLIWAASEGELSLTDLEVIVAAADGGTSQDDITWAPPVGRPGKIMGVAINNQIGQIASHRPFANPAFFFKPRTSLIGHGQPVRVRQSFGVTHPEPELAVIIGKKARNVSEADALDHVFGYSIINDVTSPGLKERDSLEIVLPEGAVSDGYTDMIKWRRVLNDDHARSVYLTYHALSKGTDTFGPMGPWIVTRDEIEDPNSLAVNSFTGDEAVFEDSTANLTFSVQRVITHASAYITLEPGDVIHCGTAMKPAAGGRFPSLTSWDIRNETAPMSVEIPGIGRLTNPVLVEEEQSGM